MPSQVDIYNFALGNIGSSDTVASLEERSKQRIICSQYWELARDSMLADFDWPFARRNQTLALLSESDTGWAYTYQYPNDCMRALHLGKSVAMNIPEAWQMSFEVGYSPTGAVIHCDYELASLTYIARIEDAGRFPPLFVQALAWKLAAMIAMPLAATRTIAETAEQMAEVKIQAAWAAALNEQHRTSDVTSEYISARGCGVYTPIVDSVRGTRGRA